MTIQQVKEEAKKRFDKDLTGEQAQAYLDVNPAGELREGDLENITGGWGGALEKVCPNCGSDALFRHLGPNEYRCVVCMKVCTR